MRTFSFTEREVIALQVLLQRETHNFEYFIKSVQCQGLEPELVDLKEILKKLEGQA